MVILRFEIFRSTDISRGLRTIFAFINARDSVFVALMYCAHILVHLLMCASVQAASAVVMSLMACLSSATEVETLCSSRKGPIAAKTDRGLHNLQCNALKQAEPIQSSSASFCALLKGFSTVNSSFGFFSVVVPSKSMSSGLRPVQTHMGTW